MSTFLIECFIGHIIHQKCGSISKRFPHLHIHCHNNAQFEPPTSFLQIGSKATVETQESQGVKAGQL